MRNRRSNPLFHFRFYRYLRYMLRRYPAMRKTMFALCCGPGVDGICQNSVAERTSAIAIRAKLKV